MVCCGNSDIVYAGWNFFLFASMDVMLWFFLLWRWIWCNCSSCSLLLCCFYLLVAELVWVVQPCLLLLQAMTMLLVVLDASWFRAIWSIWLVFYLTLLFFALFKWNMFNLQVLSPMPVFAGVKEGIWFLGCGLLWPTTCLLFAVFDGVIVARCCLGFCLLWLAFCCYCCVGLPEFIASDVGSSLTSASSPNDYLWALWNYYSGCPHFRPSDPLVSSTSVADVMLFFMLDGLTSAPLP
jgi:hypothetical protein